MSASSRVQINIPILVVGIAVLGAFVGLMLYGFTSDPRALPESAKVDQPATEFTLESVSGERVSLKALRGKPVVINFWSTWCIPCKQEHPLLQSFPKAYPEVVFLGVVYQDDAQKVERFLKRDPVPYQTLLDPNGRVAIGYGVTGVPETYFINRSGIITHKQVGPLNQEVFAEQLEAILQ
ncbi:MAG: TlpA family protein disulfide reductase [Myxococcota bacterium]